MENSFLEILLYNICTYIWNEASEHPMAGWSELLVLACVRRIIRKLIDHVRKSLTLEFWWLNTEMNWKEINLGISALAWKPKWILKIWMGKKEVLCQIGKPYHWKYIQSIVILNTQTHTHARTHFVDSCGLSTYCCSVIAVAKPNVIPLWKKQQRKNNNNNNFTEEEKKNRPTHTITLFSK